MTDSEMDKITPQVLRDKSICALMINIMNMAETGAYEADFKLSKYQIDYLRSKGFMVEAIYTVPSKGDLYPTKVYTVTW